jgi:hypothetical protein
VRRGGRCGLPRDRKHEHFPKTFKKTIIATPKEFMDFLIPQLAKLNREK